MFYRSFIQAVLTLVLICWFRNLKLRSKTNLQRVVNTCSIITGVFQFMLSVLYNRHVVRQANFTL